MKKNYRCLLIDDDLLERDVAAMYLAKITSLEIVAVCSNAIEALEILVNEEIDIVFSDINMPDISGLSLKKSLQQSPAFVFITSHAAHAAESFEVDAIDFVVKPVTFERLLKAANKAIEYHELKKHFAKHQTINEYAINRDQPAISAVDGQEYYFIREKDGFTKLAPADILFIESMGDFSKIVVTKKNKHVILVSLKSLEKQLPESHFIRVHKQFIINIQHIISLTTNEILLKEDYIVPLSLSNRQALLDKVVSKKILSR